MICKKQQNSMPNNAGQHFPRSGILPSPQRQQACRFQAKTPFPAVPRCARATEGGFRCVFPLENVKIACILCKSPPILAVRLIAQFPMCLLRRLEDGNSQKNPSSSASEGSSSQTCSRQESSTRSQSCCSTSGQSGSKACSETGSGEESGSTGNTTQAKRSLHERNDAIQGSGCRRWRSTTAAH